MEIRQLYGSREILMDGCMWWIRTKGIFFMSTLCIGKYICLEAKLLAAQKDCKYLPI